MRLRLMHAYLLSSKGKVEAMGCARKKGGRVLFLSYELLSLHLRYCLGSLVLRFQESNSNRFPIAVI